MLGDDSSVKQGHLERDHTSSPQTSLLNYALFHGPSSTSMKRMQDDIASLVAAYHKIWRKYLKT